MRSSCSAGLAAQRRRPEGEALISKQIVEHNRIQRLSMGDDILARDVDVGHCLGVAAHDLNSSTSVNVPHLYRSGRE